MYKVHYLIIYMYIYYMVVQLDMYNFGVFQFFMFDFSHFNKPSSLAIEFISHRVVEAVLQFRCGLVRLLFLVVSFL